MLSGQLAGVPENLYDAFIERELDAMPDEFVEAKLIGRVLGKYYVGFGDDWIALRIEELLRAGRLAPVTTPAADDPIYQRKLKKCGGSPQAK